MIRRAACSGPVRRARLAGHVLHDRNGTLPHERDGTAWERTPWRAVQVAALVALLNAQAGTGL